MISLIDGMEMVFVPEGSFNMGSGDRDRDAEEIETPEHTVYLNSYWIDLTEVTNEMYSQCVDEGTCSLPAGNDSWERTDYFTDDEFRDYPVILVTWQQADAYCRWAGRRLPTEAEWEKAARGPSSFRFPWGNEAPRGDLLNFCDSRCGLNWRDESTDDGYADTSPVGSYGRGASPYGVLDMAGNVREWVADWFGEEYYDESPEANPLGPSNGEFKILRGGSFDLQAIHVRSTARFQYYPQSTSFFIGFRCARSPDPIQD